jgi:hypothetical protein
MRTIRRLAIAVVLFNGVIGRPGNAQDGSLVEEFRQKAGHATYSNWICYTRMVDHGDGSRSANGCNWAEYNGRNFHSWQSGAMERFDFPGDGTIRIVWIGNYPRPESIRLVGRPKGPSIDSIRWECPKIAWEGGNSRIVGYEPAWVAMTSDLSRIAWTCGTTNPAAFPSAKRQYTLLQRN